MAVAVANRLVNASNGKPRVALVTGSAQGIGKQTAIQLAENGASVVVADLPMKEKAGKETVAEIQALGAKAIWVGLDVTSEESWMSAIQATEEHLGPLDVLVNNAGLFHHDYSIEDADMQKYKRLMAVNVDGVFLGTKHAIRSMKKNTATESRSIINLSSVAGLVGIWMGAAYCASKGAVRLLTKSTALYAAEKKYNIRCNSIHPGAVLTDMGMQAFAKPGDAEAYKKGAAERTPLGRAGEPRDIANGVVFLASEESSFMTGSEVVIDGGQYAK